MPPLFKPRRNREEGEYQGEYAGGTRQGNGTILYYGGDKYEGFWSNNKRNGHGTYYYKSLKMSVKGEWENDKRNGMGALTFVNEDIFEIE